MTWPPASVAASTVSLALSVVRYTFHASGIRPDRRCAMQPPTAGSVLGEIDVPAYSSRHLRRSSRTRRVERPALVRVEVKRSIQQGAPATKVGSGMGEAPFRRGTLSLGLTAIQRATHRCRDNISDLPAGFGLLLDSGGRPNSAKSSVFRNCGGRRSSRRPPRSPGWPRLPQAGPDEVVVAVSGRAVNVDRDQADRPGTRCPGRGTSPPAPGVPGATWPRRHRQDDVVPEAGDEGRDVVALERVDVAAQQCPLLGSTVESRVRRPSPPVSPEPVAVHC